MSAQPHHIEHVDTYVCFRAIDLGIGIELENISWYPTLDNNLGICVDPDGSNFKWGQGHLLVKGKVYRHNLLLFVSVFTVNDPADETPDGITISAYRHYSSGILTGLVTADIPMGYTPEWASSSLDVSDCLHLTDGLIAAQHPANDELLREGRPEVVQYMDMAQLRSFNDAVANKMLHEEFDESH